MSEGTLGSTSPSAMATSDSIPELKQKGSPAEIGMKLSPTGRESEAERLVKSPQKTVVAGGGACTGESAQEDEGWKGETEQTVAKEESATCTAQSVVNIDFKHQEAVSSEAVMNVEDSAISGQDHKLQEREEKSQVQQTVVSSGGGEQATSSMDEHGSEGGRRSGEEVKHAKPVSMKEEEYCDCDSVMVSWCEIKKLSSLVSMVSVQFVPTTIPH